MTRPRQLALWAPPVLLMGVIFALSSQPNLSSGLGVFDLVGRKVVHALEFGLLYVLWWRALRTVAAPLHAAGAALAITIGYAITDEVHQGYVEGRHAALHDVAIDSAGALGALALSWRRR